VWYDLR